MSNKVIIKRFGPFEYSRIPSWGAQGTVAKYGRVSWWRASSGIVVRFREHLLRLGAIR